MGVWFRRPNLNGSRAMEFLFRWLKLRSTALALMASKKSSSSGCLQQQAQILQEREQDALAELGAASARLVDTLTLPPALWAFANR